MIHTNLKSTDKYISSKYKKSGVFYNTDETGMCDIIFVSKLISVAFCVAYGKEFSDKVQKEFDSIYIANDDAILSEPNTKVDSSYQKEKIVEPIMAKTVTEEFMFKTLALIVNKEKLKDIK